MFQAEVSQQDEMSQIKEKPAENPEEDRASIKSNGKSPMNRAVKTADTLRSSIRKTFRRVAEGPLSPGGKGSKSTPKEGAAGYEPGLQPPPSPSPSEYQKGCHEEQEYVL